MVRKVTDGEKTAFNSMAIHPMQTWEWGELRQSDRVKVVRFGEYEGEKITAAYQISFHRIGKMPLTIGYCPKSLIPSEEAVKEMLAEAKKRRAILIKFEPNELACETGDKLEKLRSRYRLVQGRALFTKYSFWLDLNRSEAEMLAGMKPKTRYNLRLAERKGVKVVRGINRDDFDDYWKLMEETTKRQSFYAHNREYHRKMWEVTRKASLAVMLKAIYQKKVLTTWILFKLNNCLYYPYGASSSENKEVMANNLVMWEAIKYGKENGCKTLDLWGALGHNPSPQDPWYGFHKFKEGYGAKLVEFAGSWDLVINPISYGAFRLSEEFRWKILRLLKKSV